MVLLVMLSSMLFSQVLFLDTATAKKERGKDPSILELVLEKVVFGALGAVVASLMKVVAKFLFVKGMTAQKEIDKFDERAKNMGVRLNDITLEAPLEEIQHEMCIAKARLRLGGTHYKVYAKVESMLGRKPLSEGLLLGIMKMQVEHLKRLCSKAQRLQASRDTAFVTNELQKSGARGLHYFRLRRSLYAGRAAKHAERRLNFHLKQLSPFERELYLQSKETRDNLSFVKGQL